MDRFLLIFVQIIMIKEENIRIVFGLKIKQLRLKKGLSLSALSKLSRLSPSYLNEIEKGKKYPKADKIVILANVFQVSYDELVSLKLTGPLAPLTDLLLSNLITDLPLNIFGFDLGKMVESLSGSPAKVGAFISTIVEIARNYEMEKERFYFAALRSYQELHNNYFDELEKGCDFFIEKFEIDPTKTFSYERAVGILQEKFNYKVEEYSLEEYPELGGNRYIFIPGKEKSTLLLNPKLNTNQRLFMVGRELAFNILKVTKRSQISMLVEVSSFDHILNNFLASYCAGAVLINKHLLIDDINALFENKSWDGNQFLGLLNKYQVSPEVLLHRMTGLICNFIGIKDVFYNRFQHDLEKDRFELTKELYLGSIVNPNFSQSWFHYCRRFAGIKLLRKLQNMNDNDPIIDVQITQNLHTDDEYFCISVARSMEPTPNANSTVTIGFKINSTFRKKVKFWNDPDVEIKMVGTTCENCSVENCEERAAEPELVKTKQANNKVKDALNRLKRNYI